MLGVQLQAISAYNEAIKRDMANLKPQEIIDNKCTQKPRLILLPK